MNLNKYLEADTVCSSGVKIIFRVPLLLTHTSFSVTYGITYNKSDFSRISDINVKYILCFCAFVQNTSYEQ